MIFVKFVGLMEGQKVIFSLKEIIFSCQYKILFSKKNLRIGEIND